MSLPLGHQIHDVRVDGNAHAHFGDQHFAGGLTVNAKAAPLTDYAGLYAHNALAPVSTYVDRPDLRRQLEAQLHDRIKHVLPKTQIVIVQGMGGVGKTQLVLDYIQRHRHDYSGVFWVEASRPEAIERDYVQIYSLLYNVGQEAREKKVELQYAVSAIKRWFYERGKRALFIFDNADSIRDPNDPSYVDLRRFLPDDPNIHVILTTRDKLAVGLSETPPVEVDELRPKEAVMLFQRQAKISITRPEQQEQISQIVQTLGYLALAITLAASYVALTPRLQCNLAAYLTEYHGQRKEILAQRPTWLIHQYGQSVLTTWEATFAAMEAQNPEACQFLELLSFFNQDDIPSTFPRDAGGKTMPSWEAVLFPGKHINERKIEELFRILASFSFVKYRADKNSYSMHSLIQAWAYDRLTPAQQHHYCYVGAAALENIAYEAKTAPPTQRERLVPHVVSGCYKICTIFQSAPAEHRQIVPILSSLARFLNDCGHMEEGIAVRRSTLLKCQLWYGEDDVDTLDSMHFLAWGLCRPGQPRKILRQALSMHREVLEKQRRTLKADDPRIQESRYGIARTLWELGEEDKALSIQREVLEAQQQILGRDHVGSLRTESTLADMVAVSGQIKEAVSMKRVLVKKHRQILGFDHPETLRTEHNLVVSLTDAGELREALPAIRDIFERRRQILGENHPFTLSSMDELARILFGLGELDEALSIEQDVVKRVNENLPSDHPLHGLSARLLKKIKRGIAGAGEEAEAEAEVVTESEGEIEDMEEVERAEAEGLKRPTRRRRTTTKKKKQEKGRTSVRSSLSLLMNRIGLKS